MTSHISKVSSPKATLARLGLSPRKGLGQHFLVNKGVLVRILAAAEIKAGDTVVEVGPGLGMLTGELVSNAGLVVAVEADNELAAALGQDMASKRNLRVVWADAREIEIEDLVGHAEYKLVANLPYFAATHILRRFLESSHPPSRVVVMIQREVARRIVAKPGEMSILSVGIQMYGQPRIVSYVRASAFYPPPKVTSAIVCIDVYAEPRLKLSDSEDFFRIVRAGFSTPRKKLRNALSIGLHTSSADAERWLINARIDPMRRAETLSLQEWGALYQNYLETK